MRQRYLVPANQRATKMAVARGIATALDYTKPGDVSDWKQGVRFRVDKPDDVHLRLRVPNDWKRF